MKLLRRIVAILAGVVVLILASICSWLYLYTADLPLVAQLDQYAPPSQTVIPTGPGAVQHVIPADQLGKYLVRAVLATEGQPDSRGPIRATVDTLLWDTPPSGQMYLMQIARTLVPPERSLHRQIEELRLAQQIYRRFNQQQILTIYLNRVYLGINLIGVEDTSIRYFGKHASDLSLDEAALLAGLIHSPSLDSPINHPDRAAKRRNAVLDNMMNHGSIPQPDAEQAKAAPLIIKRTAESEASYDWNRCALDIKGHASPAHGSIHTRPGEKYQNTPVIRVEVLESGEIRNAIVDRSSGVADIDNYALSSIKNMRYKERPAGCGALENQATVNVDF